MGKRKRIFNKIISSFNTGIIDINFNDKENIKITESI